jgi:hypothetical protein
MDVSKFTSTIALEFDYEYFDKAGKTQTETIKVIANRLPFRELSKLQKQFGTINDNLSALTEIVAPLIASWSLTGEKGEPWPHDAESLMDLPYDFVSRLGEAVLGKLLPSATPNPIPANSATG